MNTLKQIKPWHALIIYLSILLITNYINSAILHAPFKETDFNLKDFFIYNFVINTTILLVKIATTSFILIAGTLFIGIKIKSKNIFKAVILAYTIPACRFIILSVWASFNWLQYSREDLFNLFTWKFTQFITPSNSILHNILEQFNLYDLVFIIVLIFLLNIFSENSLKSCRNVVLSSYVPSLIIYSLFITLIATI
nr:hypothetical protein [Labilibaculum sp.]